MACGPKRRMTGFTKTSALSERSPRLGLRQQLGSLRNGAAPLHNRPAFPQARLPILGRRGIGDKCIDNIADKYIRNMATLYFCHASLVRRKFEQRTHDLGYRGRR
jgi:hypothetical protein